jgi:ATP-dependent helicase/nuclease subunit B
MKNNLRTIAGHVPFGETLAAWVLERFGHEPLILSRTLILLPSRRAALSLREAFLRAGGGRPMLLPRIETLGDADEDALLISLPAPAPPEEVPDGRFAFERLFLLARMVQRQQQGVSGRAEPMDHALKLSAGLAGLMDECEREEVSLDGMQRIVPDVFAAHWQATVEFLKILSVHWPKIAGEQRLVSPGAHQATVLRALAEHWRQSPPAYPVIAAGTTGSVPSTTHLLAAISRLPQGYIVLPGLDLQADENYFDHMEESHPQWGMSQLLKKLGRSRKDVQPIGPGGNARTQLMSEVMRPPEISDAWRDVKLDKAQALKGLTFIDCADLQEEATVIALHLREALEQPGRTAALVTHNRGLARRVAGIMQRFGVAIDDSAGMPLKETPLVVFMRLILEAAGEALAPLPLLSLLKHPFAHVGMQRIACLETARTLEMLALRGLRRGGGIHGIQQALLKIENAPPEAHELLDRLEQAFAPLLALFTQKEASLGECVLAHIACAEMLGYEAMWNGQQAEAFSECLREALEALKAAPLSVEPGSYPGIFEELLAGRVVRPEYGMHPRLKILGPIEARMQSFDRMILGGLNEGSWPPAPASDPWFSRPMRAALGLPAPERRTGLAAHDFFMLASAPEVILTRAGKEDGAPVPPSRWWVKLEMLAGSLPATPRMLAWARALDAPDNVVPMKPPAPRPPLSARPKKISVTQVETWMRDPYALYASQILRLRALEPLGRAPDGSDFGSAVHKALERFVRAHPGALPKDALGILLRLGRQAFEELFAATGMEILWWPRFARIAEWIVGQEEKRDGLMQVLAEAEGSITLNGLLLHGRADRIEQYADGGLAIIDYKTGSLPSHKDIKSGLSSQLVLLALIAREEGFANISSPRKGEGSINLEYWQLSGGSDAGRIESIDAGKADEYAEAAKQGLTNLITRFSNPDFPYRSTPIPARGRRYSDYGHLARAKEWG